jgi:hypothetical protein
MLDQGSLGPFLDKAIKAVLDCVKGGCIIETVYLIYLMIGIAAGVCTGLIGASGVAVTVPALTTAIGTSLAVDVVASIIVSSTFNKYGNLNLRQGMYMAVAAVTGAQIASRLAALVPEIGLGRAFGVLLIINGVMFWRRGIQKSTAVACEISPAANNETGEVSERTKPSPPVLRDHILAVILGLGIGTISGFLGAGGGIMILMVLVFVLHYPVHVAIGTSTLIMAFTAASAALGYAWNGYISLPVLIFAGIGTIIGGRSTSAFANKLSEEMLGKAAGILFVVIGVGMFFI